MVVSGGKLFFNADDGIHGQELWSSDGTAAGTHLVANINTNDHGSNGPSGSFIQNLTDVNGKVFFSANDGVHGLQLWESDGTASGTHMVTDLNPQTVPGASGPAGANPQDLTNVDGTLYFTANDGIHGQELWQSDGTTAGTHMVQDIFPGAASGFSPSLGSANITKGANGAVYFTADDGRHGVELWKLHPDDLSALTLSAGGPYEVIEGQKLALHAELGGISTQGLHYSWDINGDGVFGDATGANAVINGGQLQQLNLHGGPAHHTIQVRVSDSSGTVLGTASADLEIDDAPLVLTNTSFDVTEGQKFNRNVASFTDPGGPEDVSAYQATIDWGDGTTSKATILQQGNHFRVAGQHAYAEQGTYLVKASVTDQGGPAITTQSTITVHDAPIHASRTYIRTTVGQQFSGIVAGFQDSNPLGRLVEFSASINWGDGTTSQGIIQNNGQGHYVVLGTHTFSGPGSSSIDVTINDDGHAVTVAHSTARIDPLPLMARGLTSVARVNTDFTVALAAFHNGDMSATASIDWADGSISAGTIQSDGSGGFQVFGQHRYSAVGMHTVRVAIADDGQVAHTTGTVRVVG